MKTRYETRQTIERLLELARRPGTPAEGEAAFAAAHRLADKYGFTIQRTAPRSSTSRVSPAEKRYKHAGTRRHGLCDYCGKQFVRAATGRRRHFCSTRCRVAAHRTVHS